MVKLSKDRVAMDLNLQLKLMIEARINRITPFKVLFQKVCNKLGVEYSKERFEEVQNVSRVVNFINVLGLSNDIFKSSFDTSDQKSSLLDFLIPCLGGSEIEKNYWGNNRLSMIREIRNAICHSDENENYVINDDGSIDVDAITNSGIPLKAHLSSTELYKVCSFFTRHSKRNRMIRINSASEGKDVDLSGYINYDRKTLIKKLSELEIVRLQSNLDSFRDDVFFDEISFDAEHIDDFVDSYMGMSDKIHEYKTSLTLEQCEDLANQIIKFRTMVGGYSRYFINALLFHNLEFGESHFERYIYDGFKSYFLSEDDNYSDFWGFLNKDFWTFIGDKESSKFFKKVVPEASIEPKEHYVMLYEDCCEYPYNELSNFLWYVYTHLNSNGIKTDDNQRHLRNALMHKRFTYLKTIHDSSGTFAPYICLFDNKDDIKKPKTLSDAKWTDVISYTEAINGANQILSQYSLDSSQHASGGSKK